MRNKRVTILGLLLLVGTILPAQEGVGWRYDRTGVYSKETRLLKSWPAKGPEMVWHYNGLGEGHSSVGIASNKLYVTGMTDKQGYLYVFDLTGKLLNKKMYGTEWTVNYNGSRPTPVVNDGKIYVMSGTGDLVCLDEKTLDAVWKRNIFTDFDSKNIRYGFNENPLIVGEKIIITPGGKKHNIIALNKNTGAVIWSCAGKGDIAAYCSPIYVNAQGIVPQVVTMTGEHVLGVDIETGKMLWSFYFKERNSVHPNTPIFVDNTLFIQSCENGGVLLRYKNGGREVEKVWEEKKLDPITGHSVIIGDYIYTSGWMAGRNDNWYVANRHNGKIVHTNNSLNAGTLIYADGMLYCYSEKGEMAIVKPTPDKLELISKFPITMGTDQHWAHPVIYKGVLYVRHGDALMAYKVR
jgi:outer membrane protein assembly factor BamB